MPIQRQSNAFVLKRKSLPSQDSMIFLFTKEFGKVVAIARGVKKITSRRAPHLETGNYIHVILHGRGDYHHIQETSLISGFSSIKSTSAQLQAMYAYLFALDRLLPAEQPESIIFDRTLLLFQMLHKHPSDAATITQAHLIETLDQLGYLPEARQHVRYEHIFEEVTGEKLPAYGV